MRITLSCMLLAAAPCLLAQSGPNCHVGGGGFVTNFLDAPANTQTAGTASGDLKGAVGITVLNVTPKSDGSLVMRVRHHWVLETGDTIIEGDADAVATPTPINALYVLTYPDGLEILGGTGRLEGATGKISAWGAVRMDAGQLVGRYQATICTKSVSPPSK